MTTQEFSIEFDILFNNINSNLNYSVNEYEKSVFLTQAQEEIVKNHFETQNMKREGLNNSPYRDSEFSSLFKTVGLNNGISRITNIENSIDDRLSRFILNEKFMFIINEVCTIVKKDNFGNILEKIKTNVVPVHYAEYNRLMSLPYKEPYKNES